MIDKMNEIQEEGENLRNLKYEPEWKWYCK